MRSFILPSLTSCQKFRPVYAITQLLTRPKLSCRPSLVCRYFNVTVNIELRGHNDIPILYAPKTSGRSNSLLITIIFTLFILVLLKRIKEHSPNKINNFNKEKHEELRKKVSDRYREK